jgi:hypothetical protein
MLSIFLFWLKGKKKTAGEIAGKTRCSKPLNYYSLDYSTQNKRLIFLNLRLFLIPQIT